MLVSTQEFIDSIRQIQKVSNESTDAQLWDIIHQFDINKDGFIDTDEILQVEINRCLKKYLLLRLIFRLWN